MDPEPSRASCGPAEALMSESKSNSSSSSSSSSSSRAVVVAARPTSAPAVRVKCEEDSHPRTPLPPMPGPKCAASHA
ncbi:hypothetical protein O3P69_014538 [Scylla paramamosain]|uniref:Uncharacterized protein n=1 Tax=Scylla paramamosain TaxID=85552 RepID=A0AAW0TCI0_SCYPA